MRGRIYTWFEDDFILALLLWSPAPKLQECFIRAWRSVCSRKAFDGCKSMSHLDVILPPSSDACMSLRRVVKCRSTGDP